MLLCPVWPRKDAARFSLTVTFAEASGTELVGDCLRRCCGRPEATGSSAGQLKRRGSAGNSQVVFPAKSQGKKQRRAATGAVEIGDPKREGITGGPGRGLKSRNKLQTTIDDVLGKGWLLSLLPV